MARRRFHAELVDAIGLEPRAAPTGEVLRVSSARTGCSIPVQFEGAESAELERIIAAVRAG